MAVVLDFVLSQWLPDKINLGKAIDYFFYNFSYRAHSAKIHDKLLVIDAKDDKNITRPRADYASMLQQLHRAGVRCIALDVLFLERLTPDSDGELVKIVAECSNKVVLAINFDTDQRPADIMLVKAGEGARALPDSLAEDIIPMTVPEKEAALPFDSLLFAATHLGHINSVDEEFYHFPPVIYYEKGNGKYYGSLPIEVVRLYFQGANQEIMTSDSLFRLDRIPLDKYGRMLVNFIPEDALTSTKHFLSWNGAKNLLKDTPGKFFDTVVLISNSDEVRIKTPIGFYPNWALFVSLINQLLLNRHIDASVFFSPFLFSAVFISLGLIWFLYFAHKFDKKWQRKRFIFGIGNALCLFFVFCFLYFWQQWLGIVAPLLGFNVGMLLVYAQYRRMIKPSQYVDFELSVSENYSIQVLKSPVGEEEGTASLEAFWKQKKFQEVLQRLNELKATSEDLAWIGDKSFTALFQSIIYNVLRRSLDSVKRDGNNLRLKLRLDASELIYLPWELMYSKKLSGGYLALQPQVSLTRYIPLEQPLPKPQFRTPLRISVFISSPIHLPTLDVQEERRIMEEALNPLISAGDVDLKIREHVTRSLLFDVLENDPPDVLHYIGHSSFEPEKESGFLELESEEDESGQMRAEELGGLLLDKPVKLVVLNSCQGAAAAKNNAFAGIAQNLVRAGVPAVVAMQYPIRDTSALMFSEIFYLTLIKKYSIDDAVAMARRTLAGKIGSGRQDWATPVLFMRTHDGKFFDTRT